MSWLRLMESLKVELDKSEDSAIKQLILGISFSLLSLLAYGQDLGYSGRLTNADGSPVTGPVNLRFDIAYSGTPSSYICQTTISSVALSNGVFHVNLSPTPATDCSAGDRTLEAILNDKPAAQDVLITINDMTNSKSYPAQALRYVPLSIQAKTLEKMGATTGQVLKWNGSTWAPDDDDDGGGSITQINTGTGLTGGPITSTGTISIDNVAVAQGGTGATTAAGARTNLGLGSLATVDSGSGTGRVYLNENIPDCSTTQKLHMKSNATWECIADNDTTTDATKLPLAGGTMTGNIDMNSNAIVGVSDPVSLQDAATKNYVDNLVAAVNASQWTTTGSDIYYNSGNVGIGVTSPSSKLDVLTTSGVAANFVSEGGSQAASFSRNSGSNIAIFRRFNNSGVGAGESGQILLQNETTVEGSVQNTAALTWLASDPTDSAVDGELQLKIAESGSLSTKMTIKSDGNIGIGTTSPATLLSVAGSVMLGDGGETCGATYAGVIRYNSGNMELCNGTSWSALATSGSGVTSFNGRTGAVSPASGDYNFTDLSGNIALAQIPDTTVTYAKLNISDGDIPYAKLTVADDEIPQAKVNGLTTSLSGKEDTITAGTSAQYYRGDKTFQTLDTDAVAEGSNLYFTDDRSIASPLTGYAVGTNTSLAATDTILEAFGKLEAQITSSGGDPSYGSSSSSPDDAVYVNDSGNVGIGTTTPSEKLEVNGRVKIASGSYLIASQIQSHGASDIKISDDSGRGIMIKDKGDVGVGDDSPDANLEISINGNTTGKAFLISSDDDNDGDILTVLESGNVGIGTASPVTNLDVAGPVRIGNDAGLACDGTTVGAIKYNSGNLEYCNGATWSALGVASASGVASFNGRTGAVVPASGDYNFTDLSGSIALAQIPDTTITYAKLNLSDGDIPYAKLTVADDEIPQAKVNGLATALSGKEDTIAAGTSAQYYRGDKTFQTLDTDAVAEGSNLYFLDSRVRNALMSGYSVGSALPLAATDTLLEALQKLEGQIASNDSDIAAITESQWTDSGSDIYFSGGNVGIGVSSPQHDLHIHDSGTDSRMRFTHSSTGNTSTDGVAMGLSGSNFSFYDNESSTNFLWGNGSGWLFSVLSSGNVGIGTGAPEAMLQVEGNIKANGTLLGNTLTHSPGSTTYYKIATLPASEGSSYDHLAMRFIADNNWQSSGKTVYNLLFGNRNGFTYRWSVEGGAVTNNSRVRCYEESDGSITIWAYFPSAAYSTISYSILESTLATIYPDSPEGTPTGTLVFDTGKSTTTLPTGIVNSGGRVGIGMTSPETKLHVAGSVMFGDGGETCGATYAGAVRYNSGNLELCDGSSWEALGLASSSGVASFNGRTGAVVPASGDYNFTDLSGSIALTQIPDTTITYAKLNLSDGDIPYAKLTVADDEIPQAKVNGLTTSLSGKEDTITAGTSAQYYRGDKTFQTLDTDAVAEGSNLYFTDARSIASPLTGYAAGADAAIAATDTILEAFGKVEGQIGGINESQWTTTGSDIYYDSGNVGIGTTTPSESLDVDGDIAAESSLKLNVSGTDRNAVSASTTTLQLGQASGWSKTEIYGGTTNDIDIYGSIKVDSGSNSSPGISFRSDDNTGVWNPAADTIAVSTGGAERLRVDSSGNVGIGTTSPGSKLVITHDSTITGNSNSTMIVDAESDSDTRYAMRARASTGVGTVSELLAVRADGNVGIGTTSPSAKFHVYDEIDGTFNGLVVDNRKTYGSGTGVNETSRISLSLSEASETNPINRVFGYIEAGSTSETSSTDGFMAFGTRTGGTEIERMRILNNGRVGIGETAPDTKLHVNGTIIVGDGGETCSTTYTGAMKYDGGVQYCDGTTWNLLPASSSLNSTYLRLNGSSAMTGNLNIGNNNITNLYNPSNPTDAANKSYVDTEISSLTTTSVAEGSNLYFTNARSIASTLTGYSTGANASVAATDTIVEAIGKLEGQIDANSGDPSYSSSASSPDDAVYVDDDGNVGIGTSSPKEKFNLYNNVVNSPPVMLFSGDNLIGDIRFQRVQTRDTYPDSYAMIRGFFGTGDIRRTELGLFTSDLGDSVERVRIDNEGNVGIGTTSPGDNTKLKVEGQIVAGSGSNSNGAIDFSAGNTISSSFDCSSNISFANLRDGGSYTLIITDLSTTQCDFDTATTGDDAATVTYRYLPANNVRQASTHTIYSILRSGNNVYISWSTGYAP